MHERHNLTETEPAKFAAMKQRLIELNTQIEAEGMYKDDRPMALAMGVRCWIDWERNDLDARGRNYEREQAQDEMATEGTLTFDPPEKGASVSYSASGSTAAGVASGSSLSTTHGGAGRLGVSFETSAMTQDTEITGPLKLVLWVSSTSEDMDIMCTLRNIGPDGKDVWEVGQHGGPVPLTKGWLRASHRKLDQAKSTPMRPYHAHNERLWLNPNEPVECQVEIWPTCIVLKKGHKLRLDVQPRDGVGSAPYTHYHCDYNAGATNTIYSGGDTKSYLLVPIIPAK